jgi:predicted RNase H-like nuclease (RuvC/YqgF family)
MIYLMVDEAAVNTVINRVNELTRRLRILEEQFSSMQDRWEDTQQNLVKKGNDTEKKIEEQSRSFSSLVGDLLKVKTELKDLRKQMARLAPNEKVEELEGFINMLSPMEAVTREEVRKIVQEMIGGGTA